MRKTKNTNRFTTFVRTEIKYVTQKLEVRRIRYSRLLGFIFFTVSLSFCQPNDHYRQELTCPNTSQVRPTTFFVFLCETQRGLSVIRPNTSLLYLPELAPHPVYTIPAQQYLQHTWANQIFHKQLTLQIPPPCPSSPSHSNWQPPGHPIRVFIQCPEGSTHRCCIHLTNLLQNTPH